VYTNGEKAKSVKRRLDETTGAVEHKTREWEAAAEELERTRQQAAGNVPISGGRVR
jgi:hypothetical protein